MTMWTWVAGVLCTLASTVQAADLSPARGKPGQPVDESGFVIVGGEWFCMWQSTLWNGQAKAVMFLTCAMLVLIVLLGREDD